MINSQSLSLVNTLKVIVMAIVKVIAMARTTRGKLCLSKGLRHLHSPIFGDKRDTTHVKKGSLWVKSQGIMPGRNESCSSRSVHLEIHLGWGMYVHPEEGPRMGLVWKKKADYWPEGRQRPRLTDLYEWHNLLFTAVLLPRGETHSFFLGVRLCLTSVLSKQTVSLCTLPLAAAVSLIENFVPSFTASTSVINDFFLAAKIQRKITSSL